MPAQVYFKFKSQLKFDPIPFDGLTITVKEIRKSIVAKKKMKIDESDLQLFNAASNEEYTSDDILIPENTSLIVVRLPRGSGSGPKVYNPNDKTTSKANNTVSHVAQTQLAAQKELALQSAINIQTRIPDALASAAISKMPASEEEKIATVQNQSGLDYDSSKWMSVPPKPPATYICHFCGLPGHYIKYCTYQGVKTTTAVVKKATGIPMAHTKPAVKDTPGALLTATGEYVVPIIDSKAFKEGKVEKPPFVDSESDDESKNNGPSGDNQDRDAALSSAQSGANLIGDLSNSSSALEVPKLYKCELCGGPYRSAVITPCCGESFCDECVTDKLLKNDKKCHVCGSTINADSLIPNKSLRDAVIKWQNDNSPSSLLMPPKPNINMGMREFSPAGSPHYTASGNSSPQTGNRTPHKNQPMQLAVSDTSTDSGDSGKGDVKTMRSSLSSQLQIVEEESSSSTETSKDHLPEKKENTSAGLTRKLSSGEKNNEEKLMLRKTLSDLYGAINWEDVNTSVKNNSAPKLNNLPLGGKQDNDSSSSLSMMPSNAVVNNENSSSMKSIDDKNVSSTSAHEATRVENSFVEASAKATAAVPTSGALPSEKAAAVGVDISSSTFSTSVTATCDSETSNRTENPKDSKDTSVVSGGEAKAAKSESVSSSFSLANLSQSDAELLKAFLLGVDKVAEKESVSNNSPPAASSSNVTPTKVKLPQPQLPFPPPHLIPPPVPQNSAAVAALWAATSHPAALHHMNPLHMIPAPFPVPMPPVSTAPPVGPPVSSGTPSVESLLGMSFKKPMTEREFYARQKEELSKGKGGKIISSSASSVVNAADASMKRLEAKLREQQLLQQLTSTDDSLRGDRIRDKKYRKVPHRKRSSSPRQGHSSKRVHYPRDRELSNEKKGVSSKSMRPGESGGGGAEKRPPGGASRRYHPYSIGGRWGEGDRGGGGRKRSRSRSYYSRSPPPGPSDRTPSPRRYKKYAAIKMAAEKEYRDPIEEAVHSARKQVDRLRERSTPEKMQPRKSKNKTSRRPKVANEALSPVNKRKRGSFSPGDRHSRSASKSTSPKSDRGYSSHSVERTAGKPHTKDKERRARPNKDERRKSFSRDRVTSRDRSDSRSSDIRVIEKDSDSAKRRERNDCRRRRSSLENQSPEKRQNSMTPTLDEEPIESNDGRRQSSPGRESPSNPAMIVSDFSMLEQAGVMEFETEEDRRMAADILRQAHEKILEHKRKTMKSKMAADNSGSESKTEDRKSGKMKSVEKSISEDETDLLKKADRRTDQSRSAEKQNVIVGYAESPDIALEPRGDNQQLTSSENSPEFENSRVSSKKARKLSKKETTSKGVDEKSLSDKMDMMKGLVQYGSEEDASSDANRDDVSQEEISSVVTKRVENGSTETPYSPRHTGLEKDEPSAEEDGKSTESEQKLDSVENSKLDDSGKDEDRKAKENSANSEIDPAQRSTHTSQASDYDHPQLSADEILAASQELDNGIEKTEKSVDDNVDPHECSPRKKSLKKFRVEAPPKDWELSPERVEEEKTKIAGKKMKKEKKSKSKKSKDRKSSVDSSVGTPKKESKSKKKKKKKAKEGKDSKKWKDSASYKEDDVTGGESDDESGGRRSQITVEEESPGRDNSRRDRNSAGGTKPKIAALLTSVVESSSKLSPNKQKRKALEGERDASVDQRKRSRSVRRERSKSRSETPVAQYPTRADKAVENSREYVKEWHDSEEKRSSNTKKSFVSSTISSKIIQSSQSTRSPRKKDVETSKRRHPSGNRHRSGHSKSSDYDHNRDESPRHAEVSSRRKVASIKKRTDRSSYRRSSGHDSPSPTRSVSYRSTSLSPHSKERDSHSSPSKRQTKTKVSSPPRRKVTEVPSTDDYSEKPTRVSKNSKHYRQQQPQPRPRQQQEDYSPSRGTQHGSRGGATGRSHVASSAQSKRRLPTEGDKEAQYSEISFSETEGNRSDAGDSYVHGRDQNHHKKKSNYDDAQKQQNRHAPSPDRDHTPHTRSPRSPRHKKRKRHEGDDESTERTNSSRHHHPQKVKDRLTSIPRSPSPSSTSRHSRKDKRKR